MSGEHEHCPVCFDDMCKRPTHQRVGRVATALTDEQFIVAAKDHNKHAINNNATGAWLLCALERLEATQQQEPTE